jgi:hypothetical protein
MATNNNGNLLDSEGNVFVDFVWGNFPMQPNDERADGTPTITTTVGGDQNVQWTYYSKIDSARLDPALSNHAVVEAKYAGFPAFADGDGAYISGVAYIAVPEVRGLTTALALDALKDAGYEAANITTASAAANVKKDITRINATSTSVAVVYASGADTAYPVGTKVAILAGTPAGSDPVNVPAALVGSWTVTASASGQITISGSGFTVADTTGINATGTLAGLAGTIRTQSTAASAGSISTSATITVTPWAAAS